jgi:hypothetical protein
MTYKEAENIMHAYSGVIGKPMLNKMVHLDGRIITSLLVCPLEKIKEVYSVWSQNGNNNKKATLKINKDANFEVFLMSHNPSLDTIIYYLRLSKYIELGE